MFANLAKILKENGEKCKTLIIGICKNITSHLYMHCILQQSTHLVQLTFEQFYLMYRMVGLPLIPTNQWTPLDQ